MSAGRIKISQMPDSGVISSEDLFHLVQGGNNTKLTADRFYDYLSQNSFPRVHVIEEGYPPNDLGNVGDMCFSLDAYPDPNVSFKRPWLFGPKTDKPDNPWGEGIQINHGPVGPPPFVTADANTVPWEEGADVTVTPDSDPYTGVHMDFQIPEGPVGVTPDFSADVETLEPKEEATVTITQTGPPDAHAVNLSFAIPRGERGVKGEGIDFKGNLQSVSDLPAVGENDGDAYWIEDEDALYVWGGESQKWEDLGDIRGPQGDPGKGWKSGTYNSGDSTVTFTGHDWSPELTFTTGSLKGDQGNPGVDAHNPVVGSVTTETKPDGTDAEVDVTANGEGNFDFDFKIPRGHSPAVNTVSTTTGEAGTDAIVNIASTAGYDLDFDFVIPKGDKGDTGPAGGYEPPIGIISMWAGNDVRDTVELNAKGWYLCDGGVNASGHPNASMVPDLTDKFIKGGAVGFNVGTFGGSSVTGEHTLTTEQIPSHTHGGTTESHSHKHGPQSTETGGYQKRTRQHITKKYNNYTDAADSFSARTFGTNNWQTDSQAHTHGFTTGGAGGGESHSHDNVDPPHFVVAYIIYLGESA